MTFWAIGPKAGIHSLPPVKEKMLITQAEMDEILRAEVQLDEATMPTVTETSLPDMDKEQSAIWGTRDNEILCRIEAFRKARRFK